MKAEKYQSGSKYTDGQKHYRLAIFPSNPHDLWFWRLNKKTGKLIEMPRSECVRVYLGSKKLSPDNLDFLKTIKPL